MAAWTRIGYSQYRGHILCAIQLYCFWHMTVWLFLPLLLFQRCNTFDPYLHSIVFTDKIQTKEHANAESAWGYHGYVWTNLNHMLIFGFWIQGWRGILAYSEAKTCQKLRTVLHWPSKVCTSGEKINNVRHLRHLSPLTAVMVEMYSL